MTTSGRIDIIYFTDPLCCWSWAMEPQWRKLIFQYKDHLTWTYCMGGLIPSWDGFVDNVNSVSRPAQMGPLWMYAEQISGMPMRANIWTDNAPRSSFPSCIAVKCAELQSLLSGELMLRKLREFCHLGQKDISNNKVICEAAEELALEVPSFQLTQFLIAYETKAGQDLFRKDWDETKRRNVTRFPTLFITKQGVGTIQLSGCRSVMTMKSALIQLDPELEQVGVDTGLSRFKEFWGSILSREELEFTDESFVNKPVF